MHFRLSIKNCGGREKPLINLNLKSANVIIRHVTIQDSNGQAMQIAFDADTDDKTSMAIVKYNQILNTKYQGCISIDNRGANIATYIVDKAIITL